VPLANTPQRRAPVEPPLNARYGWIVAVALLALAPNIVLTTAFPLLQKPLAAQLHMSKLFTQEAEGLSKAGYAFGTVLGAFLTQRFRQRPLFINTRRCSLSPPSSRPSRGIRPRSWPRPSPKGSLPG
jgi:hypothetical protein